MTGHWLTSTARNDHNVATGELALMGRMLHARGVRGGLAFGLLVLTCVLLPTTAATAAPSAHLAASHRIGSCARSVVAPRPVAVHAQAPRAKPAIISAHTDSVSVRSAFVIIDSPLVAEPGPRVLKSYPPRPPPGPPGPNPPSPRPSGPNPPSPSPSTPSPSVQPAPLNGGVTMPPGPTPTATAPISPTTPASSAPSSAVVTAAISSSGSASLGAAAQPSPSWPFSDTTVLVALLIGFTLAIAGMVFIAGYRGRAH
jgi:hypothetical protein